MTHDEMITIITAHKEGKQIQYRVNGLERWNDCSSKPHWDFFAGHDYRIKPAEPKKVKLYAWMRNTDGEINYRFAHEPLDAGRYTNIPELDKEITLPAEVEL